MIKRCTIIAFAMIISSTLSFAGNNIPKEIKERFKQNVSKMTKDQKRDMFLKANPRVPDFKNTADFLIKSGAVKANSTKIKHEESLQAMPLDAVFPAEYEELDAVIVTWPYDSYNKSGQYVSPVFPNLYIRYSQFGYSIDSCYSELDIDTEYDFAWLYADLVNAIQQEVPVWINVWFPEDTTTLKNFMEEINMPLTNYKFFVNHGNSFWYRDCGPVAFYYNDYQDVGFLDFEYYSGRPLDDKIPELVANEMGILNVPSTIEFEGGNLLIDGTGNLFTSTAILYGNNDTEGQIYYDETLNPPIGMITKSPLTLEKIKDSLRTQLFQNNCYVMPELNYDGGTGHIDLYADFFDENTFVFTQYPDNLSSLTDYSISKNNCEELIKIKNYHDRTYNNRNIPLPRKDNGSWYTSNNDYANLTRTFTNHLVLNKTIIQPVFHNTINGDEEGDLAALEEIKKAYPGYKIVPIDMRALDGSGGSIHCITKQIPAKNPIRILHSPLTRADEVNKSFTVNAEIHNHVGIGNAKVFWRIQGADTWNSFDLAEVDYNYTGILNIPNLLDSDIIEYYIQATDNNGKIMSKPITAPDGFYVITGTTADITDNINDNTEFYPNPASSEVNLNFEITNSAVLKIDIFSTAGDIITTKTFNGNYTGMNTLTISTDTFIQGIYNAVISQNGHIIARKSFIIVK